MKKILSITAVNAPNGVQMVVGLGDDNKTYVWSPQKGDWIPNWDLASIQADKEKQELLTLRKKMCSKKKR